MCLIEKKVNMFAEIFYNNIKNKIDTRNNTQK